MTGSPLDVRVVGPDERDPGTAQTPGLQRFAAVSSGITGSQRMWMGYAVLEPGGKTGVHHHGESETAIYVISGVTRWWVGDHLDDVREARAGDFVFIPPGSCTGSRTPATPSRSRWSSPAAPRRPLSSR